MAKVSNSPILNNVLLHGEIVGYGIYTPDTIVSNKDLTAFLDTDDDWIKQRTGISNRRISTLSVCEMGSAALVDALKSAQILPTDIDLLLVATVTPDLAFPSTACLIQQKLGLTGAVGFDIQAACSGFIYALAVANNFIRTKTYHTVAVIGVDKMSKLIDWQDRSTAVLFGDAAGAVILKSSPFQGSTSKGIIDVSIFSDGTLADILKTSIFNHSNNPDLTNLHNPAPPINPPFQELPPPIETSITNKLDSIIFKNNTLNTRQKDHLDNKSGQNNEKDQSPSFDPFAHQDYNLRQTIQMSGKDVFRHAVNKMAENIEQIVIKNGYSLNDINAIIPHQANQRITAAILEKLGQEPQKAISTISEYGNTSAASIPVSLKLAIDDGRIKSGDLVVLSAFGAGLTWGSALIRI